MACASGVALRRLGPQQRDLERLPLRRRQRLELVRADPVEQVDQRGEREPRLGAASSRREHAQPALPGRADARLPEQRLPDSRLARENERARPVRGSEELVQQRELRLAADEVIALLRGRLRACPPRRA